MTSLIKNIPCRLKINDAREGHTGGSLDFNRRKKKVTMYRVEKFCLDPGHPGPFLTN